MNPTVEVVCMEMKSCLTDRICHEKAGQASLFLPAVSKNMSFKFIQTLVILLGV